MFGFVVALSYHGICYNSTFLDDTVGANYLSRCRKECATAEASNLTPSRIACAQPRSEILSEIMAMRPIKRGHLVRTTSPYLSTKRKSLKKPARYPPRYPTFHRRPFPIQKWEHNPILHLVAASPPTLRNKLLVFLNRPLSLLSSQRPYHIGLHFL
jgi:hypothetical protein